jgi:hypothetical protein
LPPTISPFDGYTPGQAMANNTLGSYPLSGIETLNLGNGIVSINIPLITASGRGSVAVPLTAQLNGPVRSVSDIPWAQCTDQTHSCPKQDRVDVGTAESKGDWERRSEGLRMRSPFFWNGRLS